MNLHEAGSGITVDIEGGTFVIAGGASLVGSHLAEQLLQDGAGRVVLLDNYALGTPDMVAHLLADPRVRLIRADILHANELHDAFKGAAGVFAVAGFLSLPLGRNPALGLAVNVQGLLNILDACRHCGVQNVVFSSSIAVYGVPEVSLVNEAAPLNWAVFKPETTLYAASKVIGEALCQLYHRECGIKTVSLRYSTIYGERQHRRGLNAVFIIDSIERVARGERPIIYGDGMEVHDYIHVSDVAKANVSAMQSDAGGECFNVATGTATSIKRVAEIILQATGSALRPDYRDVDGACRPAYTNSLSLDVSRARRTLGFHPEVKIEDGIRKLVDWSRLQAGT